MTPAAPLPRGRLHLALSPPRSAARAWPGLAHVHPCCPGPLSGPAPSSLRAACAGVPAPRSRRGPAAPDSRRQGPSPSRPKAEEKGAEKASPALARRAPHEPSAAGVGGTAAAAGAPGPGPAPRPGAGRTRELWQRGHRNHGGGGRAAPGRDPVPADPGRRGPPGAGAGRADPQLGGSWGAARAARGAHSLTGVEGGGGHVRGQVRFVRHPPERRGAPGHSGARPARAAAKAARPGGGEAAPASVRPSVRPPSSRALFVVDGSGRTGKYGRPSP